MILEIDTKDVVQVKREVEHCFRRAFPAKDGKFVSDAFAWANDCFTGNYLDYQPIDARYHDFEHTLQVTLCMMRLLANRCREGALPVIDEKMFQLGLLAILLHDTGYLKKKGDTDGTGAKYTFIHVERSMEFAANLLREKNFSEQEIKSVQNMIRCTGVNVSLAAIPFQNEAERITGFALGTGDLLGQMAAKDYIEKLPVLYLEFAEAAQFNSEQATSEKIFSSAEDLLKKTPGFWEKFVKPKIENDFLGLYRFLNNPFPSGLNIYIDRIEKNIARLQSPVS